MTKTQSPYTTTRDQAEAEEAAIAAELRAIRLATIQDQIDAAEERGRDSVHLMIDDARWLVNRAWRG